MSGWVDFRELRQSLSIEQVLTGYRVPLKRVGGINCAAPVRRRRMARSGAGRVSAWTPPRTCGRVTRPPVVRPVRAEWEVTFWIWWRVWRGARFGRPRCACRRSGVELEDNGLQKEAPRAEARIDPILCRSRSAWAGIRTWRSARWTRPRPPGLESATMPVADGCGIGW